MSLFRPAWYAARRRSEPSPLNTLLAKCLADMEANPGQFETFWGGRVLIGPKFVLRKVDDDGTFGKALVLEVQGKALADAKIIKKDWREANCEEAAFALPWYWRPLFEEARDTLLIRAANRLFETPDGGE